MPRRHLSHPVLSCTLAGAVLAAAFGAQAATPAVDCRKARNAADRMICAKPDTLAIDREIAALYDRGLAEFDPVGRHRLAQSQVAYLHHRNGCAWAAHHSAHPGPAVSECVRSLMDERLHTLRVTVDQVSSR